MTKDMVASGF